MVTALSWILGALEPPGAVLDRARAAAAEEARMANTGAREQTARVQGPGGAVVIPLRLVAHCPEEVARLVRQATQPQPEPEEVRER